jgi:hypothetical protein
MIAPRAIASFNGAFGREAAAIGSFRTGRSNVLEHDSIDLGISQTVASG